MYKYTIINDETHIEFLIDVKLLQNSSYFSKLNSKSEIMLKIMKKTIKNNEI